MKTYASDNKPKVQRMVACCYLDWSKREAGPASEVVFGHQQALSLANMIPPAGGNCSLGTPLWQLDTAHFNKFLSSRGLQKDCQLTCGLHPLKALVTNWGSNSNLSQPSVPSNLLWRLTAHLHPYKKGATSPSVFVLKSKADIYLPYTFRITSFCTGILLKPCLSLKGTCQLETKTPKILRKFPVCLAHFTTI